MECLVARKLDRDLKDRGSDQENAHGKMQLPLHMKCTILFAQRIPEERTNSGCGNHSQGCIQQSPVQAADGPVRSTWSQPNADPMGCRSAPGKNSGYAAWKPELCSSSAHSGPTTRITALISPLQCIIYQGPGRSEAKWTHQDASNTRELITAQKTSHKYSNKDLSCLRVYNYKHVHVPLVEFMYLIFTCMPGESYRRQLKSLSLYLCDIYVPLAEFMYLVFTHMAGETYHRRLRFLVFYLCNVFQVLINSLVCWYFSAIKNPHNPLHEAVKDTKGCRLGGGKTWMGQAEDSTQHVCNLTELKQTKEWER